MDIKQRETYNERVKPFVGKDMINVLTGQRRRGDKGCTLRQLARDIRRGSSKANIVYVNM